VNDLFDAGAMYEGDYLHFFGGAAGDGVVDLVWRLLGLEPGMEVLDLACGHGPLANPLARRGCRVTGLDSSEVFLERARADAGALGVDVDYRVGDMRELPWRDRFDRVVNWSTAFGYFEDDVNRLVLEQIAGALRPGGRLAMDLNNLTSRLTGFQPARVLVHEDGDRLVDRFRLDARTSRLWVDRTMIRLAPDGSPGRPRDLTFMVRLFGFPEIRDWLVEAGLCDVEGYGEDGRPLEARHERMILVATRG
jgi:SAM-dependent methyltransferase